MWEWHDSMGWWVALGGLWVILFWAAIIAVIVWAVKKIIEKPEKKMKEESDDKALTILKERYAKGEISKEEFEQVKSDIAK